MNRGPTSVFGFTLIELLLVIAIIGVLAGVSFPLIRKSIKSTEFKYFTNKVYLFLDYSKTQAILKNKSLIVRVDLEDRKINLLDKDEDKENQILYNIHLPDRMQIKLKTEEIVFHPDGTLQPFEINIIDDENRLSVISSEGIDGKAIIDRKTTNAAG